MSDSLSNETNPINESSEIEPSSSSSFDKKKLSFSLSENTLDYQRNSRLAKPLLKVKSWSSKDFYSDQKCMSVELDLARSLTKLDVAPNNNNNNMSTNLLRARDSLDNLLKDEQNMPKSSLDGSVLHLKPRNIAESPKSSPQLGENHNKASTSWDPYDRNKRHRKDSKRKSNKHKNTESPRNIDGSNKITGKNAMDHTNEEMEEENGQKYKYLAKNSKSVEFTNEVLVVYFNNDDVVGEEKEPLKKEVEQQTRNKEMRRIHLNKTQEKYNLCLF